MVGPNGRKNTTRRQRSSLMIHTKKHKSIRRCPQLKAYFEHLQNLNVKKRRSGPVGGYHYYYPSWEEYTDLLPAIGGPTPGFKSHCGHCGAFKLWKDRIQSVFDDQPRWEAFYFLNFFQWSFSFVVKVIST
ncbi:hypothetical protein L218DRAFT_737552 [Marasmius fiardii PR-910]|nr:hypothetical protein L218DRAFT_737552 [Marasmius fiardii PR-910]